MPPDQYSKCVSFLLTAQKPGHSRINVEVYSVDDVYLGTIPIETIIGGAVLLSTVKVAALILVVEVVEQDAAQLLSRFLSIAENQMAVRVISQQVLAEVEPGEIKTAGFIEPLIDMVARGEAVTVDTSGEVGGLGQADPMVLVVVPLVVTILGNLLAKLGEVGVGELRKKLKREKEAKAFIKITVGDIEAIVSSTKSPRGKRKIKELAKAVNAALAAYLES